MSNEKKTKKAILKVRFFTFLMVTVEVTGMCRKDQVARQNFLWDVVWKNLYNYRHQFIQPFQQILEASGF